MRVFVDPSLDGPRGPKAGGGVGSELHRLAQGVPCRRASQLCSLQARLLGQATRLPGVRIRARS
jgi:hypothetical protein